MLTGKQKKALRARGNQLKAEIWIGKEGISDGTLHTLENSFNTKELVKLKLQENAPVSVEEAGKMLCQRCRAELVQTIGSTMLLYRPLPDKE